MERIPPPPPSSILYAEDIETPSESSESSCDAEVLSVDRHKPSTQEGDVEQRSRGSLMDGYDPLVGLSLTSIIGHGGWFDHGVDEHEDEEYESFTSSTSLSSEDGEAENQDEADGGTQDGDNAYGLQLHYVPELEATIGTKGTTTSDAVDAAANSMHSSGPPPPSGVTGLYSDEALRSTMALFNKPQRTAEENVLLYYRTPPSLSDLIGGPVLNKEPQAQQQTNRWDSFFWNKLFQSALDEILVCERSIRRLTHHTHNTTTTPSHTPLGEDETTVGEDEEPVEKYRRRLVNALSILATHGKDFDGAAKLYGSIIITEKFLPVQDKTIKPCKDLSGYIGGEKYVKHGILFKFAVDHKNIYGGDQFAAKVASHDLRGLMCFFEQQRLLGLPIRVPMMALIDYRGFRLEAMSLLPIRHCDTIVYGSMNAGRDFYMRSKAFEHSIRRTCQALNLKPHLSRDKRGHTIYSPTDLEGHKSLDDQSRLYAVDFSRLFPPVFIDERRYPRGHLYRLFRPEFLQLYHTPLCSDAFTKMGMVGGAQHEREIYQATIYLQNTVVRSVGNRLVALFTQDPSMASNVIDIDMFLHQHGVNLRYMGLVRSYIVGGCASHSDGVQSSPSPLDSVESHAPMSVPAVKRMMRKQREQLQSSERYLLLESSNISRGCCAEEVTKQLSDLLLIRMIGRVIKKLVEIRLRDRMKKARLPLDGIYLLETVNMLNVVFGNTKESTTYWREVVAPLLIEKFRGALTDEEMRTLGFRRPSIRCVVPEPSAEFSKEEIEEGYEQVVEDMSHAMAPTPPTPPGPRKMERGIERRESHASSDDGGGKVHSLKSAVDLQTLFLYIQSLTGHVWSAPLIEQVRCAPEPLFARANPFSGTDLLSMPPRVKGIPLVSQAEADVFMDKAKQSKGSEQRWLLEQAMGKYQKALAQMPGSLTLLKSTANALALQGSSKHLKHALHYLSMCETRAVGIDRIRILLRKGGLLERLAGLLYQGQEKLEHLEGAMGQYTEAISSLMAIRDHHARMDRITTPTTSTISPKALRASSLRHGRGGKVEEELEEDHESEMMRLHHDALLGACEDSLGRVRALTHRLAGESLRLVRTIECEYHVESISEIVLHREEEETSPSSKPTEGRGTPSSSSRVVILMGARNGWIIAVDHHSNTIVEKDLRKPTWRLTPHTANITGMILDDKRNILITGSLDNGMSIVDVRNRCIIGPLPNECAMPVQTICCDVESTTIVCAQGKYVSSYDYMERRQLVRYVGHTRGVVHVEANAKLDLLVSCTGMKMRMWELSTGKCLFTFEDMKAVGSAIIPSSSTQSNVAPNVLVVPMMGKCVRISILDIATRKEMHRIEKEDVGAVDSFMVEQSRNIRLWIGTSDGRVLIYGLSPSGARLLKDIKHDYLSTCVHKIKSTKHMIGTCTKDSVRLWDRQTLQQVRQIKCREEINNFAFNQNCVAIACISSRKGPRVHVWGYQ